MPAKAGYRLFVDTARQQFALRIFTQNMSFLGIAHTKTFTVFRRRFFAATGISSLAMKMVAGEHFDEN